MRFVFNTQPSYSPSGYSAIALELEGLASALPSLKQRKYELQHNALYKYNLVPIEIYVKFKLVNVKPHPAAQHLSQASF
jgi:hypothetical protein